jgi:hypothetical protein
LVADAESAGDGPASSCAPADDAYTELADVPMSEDGLLGFAAKHGYLGVERTHFHSDATDERYAESFDAWALAVQEFQNWYGVWGSLETGSIRDIRSRPEGLTEWRKWKDVRVSAKRLLVDSINQHLRAGVVRHAHFEKPCYIDGCQWHTPPAKITPHVSYELQFDPKRDAIQAKVFPYNLITAVWLQFADLLCGSRKVVRCQLCGKWMDISETARPTAKRMHDRCSHAERMRRYRENKG